MRDDVAQGWTFALLEPRRPSRLLFVREAIFNILAMAALGTIAVFFLVTAYTLKQALGLDVFPSIDMLPDKEIQIILADLFN